MKYFGKKSLSSWLSKFLKIARWIVLVGAILCSVFGLLFIAFASLGAALSADGTTGASRVESAVSETSADAEYEKVSGLGAQLRTRYEQFHSGMSEKDRTDFDKFNKLPLFVKILMFPYVWAVVIFLLKLMRRAQELFENFSNNILFNRSNVDLLITISKLTIVVSILTFSVSSLLVSLFLFMICEIFKNGTVLQEEHDLTV
jgi:hypothetical protein